MKKKEKIKWLEWKIKSLENSKKSLESDIDVLINKKGTAEHTFVTLKYDYLKRLGESFDRLLYGNGLFSQFQNDTNKIELTIKEGCSFGKKELQKLLEDGYVIESLNANRKSCPIEGNSWLYVLTKK